MQRLFTQNTLSNSALFLTPAVSLALPSGYSYGPALLIVASLLHLRKWYPKITMPRALIHIYTSFLLLTLCWLIDNLISREGASSFEKPLKIALALPGLYYLMLRPANPRWLWHGVVVGAIAATLVAGFQIGTAHPYWIEHHRVTGYTNAIQFGDIALMLGLLSLTGWNLPSHQPKRWRLWLIIGFTAGILASATSGTRGGWLTLGLLGTLYLIYLMKHKRWNNLLIFSSITFTALLLALQLPQLHLKERINIATSEAIEYQQNGTAATSVGARLQLWNFSWNLFLKKPIIGWTQQGFMIQKQRAIDEKQMHPALGPFNHAHNEILDTAAKRGFVGLLFLLAAYWIPIRFFSAQLNNTHPDQRALAGAGLIICICYIGFGLTQSFLPHNSGIMLYAYLTLMIAATSVAAQPGKQR